MKNSKGFIALPLIIFAAAVAVGVAGYFGGYFDIVAKKATMGDNKMGGVVVDETDVSNGSTSFDNAQDESLTASWQTYRNEVHGYELKYPAGWTVRAWEKIAYFCSLGVQACGPEPHDIKANISVMVARGETRLLEEYLQSPGQGAKITGEITLAGEQAYITGRVSDNFGAFIEKQVYVKKSDSLYQITAYARGYSESVFDHILSTFKFIN